MKKFRSKKEKISNSEKKGNIKRRIKMGITTIIFLASTFILGFNIYIENIRPFDSIKINVGEEITIDEFFSSALKNASFITDVSKIDTSKLGLYDIYIKVNGQKFKSSLEIVDEIAPIVEVQDLDLSFYEEISAEDFVVEVDDDTECSISFKEEFTPVVGNQTLVIVVVDEAGNKTEKEVNLKLSKIKEEVTLEAGTEFSWEDVLYNADKVEDKEIIEEINTSKLGEQDLVVKIDDEEYTVKVTIEDTEKPVVKTKNVTIWWDKKISGVDSLISGVSDATKVTKEMTSTIDYSKIGTQTVNIKVTDEAGNVTEATAKVTIKKDTTGPKIKNLSDISVIRGNTINYTSGVKATDDHDGTVSFTYDNSSVDTSKPGTYTVKYTAKDSSGNTTTSSRKVVITGNLSDVKAKLKSVVNNIVASNSTESARALAIRNWVYNNISYYHTPSYRTVTTAAWYGITNHKGDCYVHYALSKVMLDMAGITNKEIHNTTKSHYWNLVYVDGAWRHLDSTIAKANKLMTDEEYTLKTWDKSSYPAAE